MTDGISRRKLLSAGSALGATTSIIALAGCLNTEEPWLDIDQPQDIGTFPIDVGDAAVNERIERVDSLLKPIPDDLGGEGLRDAREHVEDRRSRALDALEDDQPSNYARLSRLRSAREWAANAEGSYAAVQDDRTQTNVEDELTDVERDLGALEADLSWSGGDLQAAAIVYDTIEYQLDSAGESLDRAAEEASFDHPDESDFDLVGYLSRQRGRAIAALKDAEYLLDRQADRGDQSLDEVFEHVVSNQLEDHRERIEDLPTDLEEASELIFGESIDSSVHEAVVKRLIRTPERTHDRAREHLESDRLARAVLDVLTLESDLLAIEYVKSEDNVVIEDPEDADDIAATKRTAVEAVETAASSADNSYFTGHLLQEVQSDIQYSDEILEEPRREVDVTWATAFHLVGTVRARVAEESTERLLASLPQ